jgi:hypothetical protein
MLHHLGSCCCFENILGWMAFTPEIPVLLHPFGLMMIAYANLQRFAMNFKGRRHVEARFLKF